MSQLEAAFFYGDYSDLFHELHEIMENENSENTNPLEEFS